MTSRGALRLDRAAVAGMIAVAVPAAAATAPTAGTVTFDDVDLFVR